MIPRAPIEMMLDGVEWMALPPPESPSGDDTPRATHSGILRIADQELRVYQLDNGERIIDADDLAAFLDGPLEVR